MHDDKSFLERPTDPPAGGEPADAVRRIEELLSWLRAAEARAANADSRIEDMERHTANLATELHEAEARAVNGVARIEDMGRYAADLATKLREAEARAVNAEARLKDAERHLADLLRQLGMAEAKQSNAQSRLRDAERVAAERQRQNLALQASLRIRHAGSERDPDITAQPDTALEALLNEHGLFELSALVKTRRCFDEAGDPSAGDAEVIR